MVHLSRASIYLSLILSLSLPLVPRVAAAELADASILLLRTAPNTQTGGEVCIRMPLADSGTEDAVRITFPSAFSVNANPFNWTVTTTGIPDTATPWPGIGTATAVSGQNVTFPSNNLLANTRYCFRFSGTNTLTNPASAGSYHGLIRTEEDGSTIDSSAYALPVGTDQISVNAVVPANANDFSADMALTTPSGTTFPQETTLTYELTYGSNLPSAANITVEAEWSLGTIDGSGTPSIEILDYVVGSATNGYNNAPPIIDTVNRTISWTIPAFPGNTTGETVSFKLKTNAAYTGDALVSFEVAGRVVGPGAQSPDSTVTKNYLYNPPTAPTPTPTAPSGQPGAATSAPDTQPTTTPTISPNPSTPLAFRSVSIQTITTTGATVRATTTLPATMTLSYGTSPSALPQALTASSSRSSLFELKDLLPNTTYYFRIRASSGTQTTTTDIFTITTARATSTTTINVGSLLVVSENIFVYDAEQAAEGKIDPFIILPTDMPYSFTFSLENHDAIQQIQAFLRPKQTLGIDTDTPAETNIALLEVKPGEYIGKLLSPVSPNNYTLFIRISDLNGNIFEEALGDFKVIRPLTVLDAATGSPLEGIDVTFSLYNPDTRLYTQIEPGFLAIENPTKTLPDGTTTTVLPQGQYRAEVGGVRYEKQTVEFILGEADGEEFPTVRLVKKDFSPLTLIAYQADSFMNFIEKTTDYVSALRDSYRSFELLAFLTLIVVLLFTFQTLLSRTHHTTSSFWHYIRHHMSRSTSTLPQKGIIRDAETNRPLARATVVLFHGKEVVGSTMTNINGVFYLGNKRVTHLEIDMPGYEEAHFPFNKQIGEKTPSFYLKGREGVVKHTAYSLITLTHVMFGGLLEFFLILMLLLSIVFIPTFGLLKVAPFILLTAVMLIAYLHHLASKH